MGKVVIDFPDEPHGHPFLSTAVRAGDFIYVSGHAGLPPESLARGSGDTNTNDLVKGGIEAETRQTLERLKQAIEAAGATLQDVVKVNAFLRDVDRDFQAYNRVYMEYFPTEPPARTSVGAKLYGRILVEIECIAYAPLPVPGGR